MPNGMFAYKGREALQKQDEERASVLLKDLTAKVKMATKEEEDAALAAVKETIYSAPAPAVSTAELPPMAVEKKGSS